ncbi:MAG: 2-oxoglutarate dehydrogenase E1 component [Phycisphaerae bacterium]
MALHNGSMTLPNPTNLAFVEALLEDFLRDETSVPEEWRGYLRELVQSSDGDLRQSYEPTFRARSIFNPRATLNGSSNGAASVAGALDRDSQSRQDRVDQMVRAYRVRGHMIAHLDPLGLPRPSTAELDPSFFGFSEADMDKPFSSRTICGPNVRTLREILERLWNTYCRFIGVQFMHIDDLSVRHWLQERMEGTENRIALSRNQQLRILTHLTDAVIFEDFIQKKFLGAKSFSLEGAESVIPLLDLAIEKAGTQGIEEVVIGMAHRGRLNVLANILEKSPRRIFREFEDKDAERNVGRGDVKYHLGFHNDFVCENGRRVHLALCFNPSHLEYVNPVAMGRLRAKQDRGGDFDRSRGLCLCIHGDAAFAGEGVVQEMLNLSELPGYEVGGTLHIVINNQLGFTTSPAQGRSTPYATDVAKMLQSPIFHVNGENPEAVAQVVELAMDFRKEFKRDVIIDMYCYRRRGHNETDEPMFTQPLMYKAIQERPSVREGYLEHLLELGGVTREEADKIAEARRETLERELSAVDEAPKSTRQRSALAMLWRQYQGGPDAEAKEVSTTCEREKLAQLLERQTRLPEGFSAHKTIKRLLQQRREMADGERPLDWAAAEALAFASLAMEGFRVRLSGQDSERGTFSQRHAVLHDVNTGERYFPLQHLSEGQAPVEIFNSPLSEIGVMGFEYGYSIASPDGLIMWEAQFGDFVNCAQVIIDQFIASAEYKWESLNGLVLLLPHGFEGQGPEHSSARIERFLQTAAEDNIQVIYPSTPAQYYHALRRQVLRPYRKPLIVFTPKKLLRLPAASSTMAELAEGTFQRVIPDPDLHGKKVRRVLLCSGKIFYELMDRRAELKCDDIAIARIEQYYPIRDEHMEEVVGTYPKGTPIFWVQEEPENMGAWRFLLVKFGRTLLDRYPFERISRPAAASPATGSGASHKLEQELILNRAFDLCTEKSSAK